MSKNYGKMTMNQEAILQKMENGSLDMRLVPLNWKLNVLKQVLN